MCVSVSVLCVCAHTPCTPFCPHSRPRLVPPTFPRCARTGLLSLRGDVCSEVHSPLLGLWGPAFQLSQEGTPRKRRGWHSKGGAANPESPQAGPGGSLSHGCRGGGGAQRGGSPEDCSTPRLLPCLAAWCGCSAGSCAGCWTEGGGGGTLSSPGGPSGRPRGSPTELWEVSQPTGQGRGAGSKPTKQGRVSCRRPGSLCLPDGQEAPSHLGSCKPQRLPWLMPALSPSSRPRWVCGGEGQWGVRGVGVASVLGPLPLGPWDPGMGLRWNPRTLPGAHSVPPLPTGTLGLAATVSTMGHGSIFQTRQ